jgi:SpoVK/Ycf46/Vps4 family AAA+-type ATPase
VRTTTSARFGPLAQRLPLDATREELVVSDDVLLELDLATSWLRHGARVFGEWGLGRSRDRTLGLTALFHGPPGTGKTLAARILAREVGLDLYRIDLSQTMDKYIGETEKNLSRIFDAAREANAVLLFDEADAVFGKRTQVRDAHDRYANVETAYLLQRLEEHEGPVILCTNLFANLDDAFLRRLHIVARFEVPGAAQRARIWALHLPEPEVRQPDIDLDFLGERFPMAGGDIRNATVAAGLFAAREGARIGMGHLARGIHRELRKTGRIVDLARFGPWRQAIAAS